MQQVNYIKNLTSSVYCQNTKSNFARNTDFHIHDCCEIYYLSEGSVTIYVNQSCYVLKAGDLLLMSNLEIHKTLAHTGFDFNRKIVHVHPNYARQYSTHQTDLLTCFYNHPIGIQNLIHLDTIKQKQYESYFERLNAPSSQNYGDDLLKKTTLIDLMVSINIWQQSQDKIVEPVCDERLVPIMNYIENHLSENFSLDDIANANFMDRYYMCHLFKKLTGSSIFQYVLMKRIALSKELLMKGNTVTSTCSMAGFNDYSNFIRTFKKITGYTPGYFRKHI
ncbi:AraC family transcriptional regulator [Clostridium hydrogenum]|uniref:AraC family transcriptional regulator n=1 Tax=Clostridium hydrogenum TaxID=2855764 RepID=UPI001F3F4796|nr:AraC family transcriptional regulator [Clostridium hydrogenum]